MIKIKPEVQIAFKAAQNDFQLAPKFDLTSNVMVWCLSNDGFQHCACVALTRVELAANTDEGIRELINHRFEHARQTIVNSELTEGWGK